MPTRRKFRRNNRNKNKSRRKRQRGGGGENVCKKKKICPCPRNKAGTRFGGTNKDCTSARSSEQSYLKFILKWMEGKNTEEFKKWFEKPDEAVILQNFTEKIPEDLKKIADSPYVVDEHGVSKDTFHSFFKYENNKWVSKINEKIKIVNKLNEWIDLQLKAKVQIDEAKKPKIKRQFLQQVGLNQLKLEDLKIDDEDLKKLKGKKAKVLLDIIENLDFMEKIDATPDYWGELIDPVTKAKIGTTKPIEEGKSYLRKWEDMWVEYVNSDQLFKNNDDEKLKFKDGNEKNPTQKNYRELHLTAINSLINQIQIIKSLKLKNNKDITDGLITTIKGKIKSLFKLFEFLFIPYNLKDPEQKKLRKDTKLGNIDIKLDFMITNNPGNTIWQITIPENKEKNIPEQKIAPFDSFINAIEKKLKETKWNEGFLAKVEAGLERDITFNHHTNETGQNKLETVTDEQIKARKATIEMASPQEISLELEFALLRFLRANILNPSKPIKLCYKLFKKTGRRPTKRDIQTSSFGSKCGGRKTRRRRRKRKRKKTRRRRRRRR